MSCLNNDEYKKIYLPDIVGKGYKAFWQFKGRYRVCKGSRASKKSKTTALWFIYNMMKYPESNLLVVRKTYRTLKDSCFTELRWAAKRLEVEHLWRFTTSPLEAEYVPTGQKIYFRGLDDPLKITSIAVEVGCLCWMWLEEAYEITNESDFDTLDESIRGEVPEGLFKQVTLTFNPWNEKIWIKSRFFDEPDDDTLALTTNYKCNEWLDKSDEKVFERMKKNNPRRYQVAGLGNWGVVEGLIFENWEEKAYTLNELSENVQTIAGLDFGYTNDPSALVIGFVDAARKIIYIWDEMYEKRLTNTMIADKIKDMGYGKEVITADCAEPKSIAELRNEGLRINAARKGRDSINNGIQLIQDYKLIIHPRCVNFITEISCYVWKQDKFGKALNIPIDDFNHLMDALRYATEDLHGDTFSFD